MDSLILKKHKIEDGPKKRDANEAGKTYEEETQTFQVFIYNWNGQSFMLDVHRTDKVDDVKKRIQSREGVKLKEQRLVCRGKELYGCRTLSKCEVTKESTIHLFVKLHGGVPLEQPRYIGLIPGSEMTGGFAIYALVWMRKANALRSLTREWTEAQGRMDHVCMKLITTRFHWERLSAAARQRYETYFDHARTDHPEFFPTPRTYSFESMVAAICKVEGVPLTANQPPPGSTWQQYLHQLKNWIGVRLKHHIYIIEKTPLRSYQMYGIEFRVQLLLCLKNLWLAAHQTTQGVQNQVANASVQRLARETANWVRALNVPIIAALTAIQGHEASALRHRNSTVDTFNQAHGYFSHGFYQMAIDLAPTCQQNANLTSTAADAATNLLEQAQYFEEAVWRANMAQGYADTAQNRAQTLFGMLP